MIRPNLMSRPMRATLLALSLGFGLAGAALADTGIMTGDSAMGKVLTDAKGMTLYTFDKDYGGHVGLLRQMRGQLAAAAGAGRSHGRRRITA